MNARIYRSSKGGWYLYGTNFKDKEDKAYCNLFFPQNSEPNTTGDYLDINIKEAKGNSYKNKFGLTVFKYEILEEGKKEESGEIVIDSDSLPFY